MKGRILYLNCAGFIIKLIFEKSESTTYFATLQREIKSVWGSGKLLTNRPKHFDIKIVFQKESKRLMIIRNKDKSEIYHMIYKKVPNRGEILVQEPISLFQFNVLVKDITIELARRDGFTLHASGSIDKNGLLKLFLAKSGGGKTTTRKLYMQGSGDAFFCDDSVIIRYINSKWIFFSPPFMEKDNIPSYKKASDAYLYLVTKSKHSKVTRLDDRMHAIRKLLNGTWTSDEDVDKKTLRKIIRFAGSHLFFKLNNCLDYKKLTKTINSFKNISGE